MLGPLLDAGVVPMPEVRRSCERYRSPPDVQRCTSAPRRLWPQELNPREQAPLPNDPRRRAATPLKTWIRSRALAPRARDHVDHHVRRNRPQLGGVAGEAVAVAEQASHRWRKIGGARAAMEHRDLVTAVVQVGDDEAADE